MMWYLYCVHTGNSAHGSGTARENASVNMCRAELYRTGPEETTVPHGTARHGTARLQIALMNEIVL